MELLSFSCRTVVVKVRAAFGAHFHLKFPSVVCMSVFSSKRFYFAESCDMLLQRKVMNLSANRSTL